MKSRFSAGVAKIYNVYIRIYFSELYAKKFLSKGNAPIFFAYFREKYEELTLDDYFTLPQEVLTNLWMANGL